MLSIRIMLTCMTAASMLDCTDRKPAYQYDGTLQLLDEKLKQVSVGKKKKKEFDLYVSICLCICVLTYV